ncbi:MAG: transposase [Acholeplasma sp.]|nr:transposase [Acholeplasma sp.]
MSKGQRFTDEFKTQIVRLYQTGKPVIQLSKEYEIAIESRNHELTVFGCFINHVIDILITDIL